MTCGWFVWKVLVSHVGFWERKKEWIGQIEKKEKKMQFSLSMQNKERKRAKKTKRASSFGNMIWLVLQKEGIIPKEKKASADLFP